MFQLQDSLNNSVLLPTRQFEECHSRLFLFLIIPHCVYNIGDFAKSHVYVVNKGQIIKSVVANTVWKIPFTVQYWVKGFTALNVADEVS